MIPIAEVVADEVTERLVLAVLRSGRLAQGPMVDQFEAGFRGFTGAAHAVALNSGTAALEAALFAAGVGPGDEVITSPFTFAATLNAILASGATARFADIGPDYCLDPASVADLCTARTRAVVVVHLYGCPADLEVLAGLAAQRGIVLIEDAAQALGASVGGRHVGTFGLGGFSFYATKNLSTGEGGMFTTDDAEVARTVRLLRNQGMAGSYEYELPGRNLRMPEMSAALGVAQLPHLPERNAARRRNAAVLAEALADVEGLLLPNEPPGRTHVYNLYTVEVREDWPVSRDDLWSALRRKGIGAGVYYPRLVFDYPCYQALSRVSLDPVPNAERASRGVVSLPVHPGLRPSELEAVAVATRAAMVGS